MAPCLSFVGNMVGGLPPPPPHPFLGQGRAVLFNAPRSAFLHLFFRLLPQQTTNKQQPKGGRPAPPRTPPQDENRRDQPQNPKTKIGEPPPIDIGSASPEVLDPGDPVLVRRGVDAGPGPAQGLLRAGGRLAREPRWSGSPASAARFAVSFFGGRVPLLNQRGEYRGLPAVPLYPFFLGEGSPTEIDYIKKLVPTYSNLSQGVLLAK